LAQALAAGVPCERILLIGPAKSRFELDFAVRHQFRAIVVESEEELDDVESLALHHQTVANVMVRVNPDFQSHGVRLTMTGASTQFGMETALAVDLVRRIDASTALRWGGLHVYIGTRILDAKAVVENFKNIIRLAAQLKEQSGVDVPVIDFGGGLGVPYFEGENDLDLEGLGGELKDILDAHQESNPGTRYLLESGRYIVAQCGRYVTTVRQVKQSKNARWILTAGGTNQFSAHNFMGGLMRRNFPIQLLPTSPGRSSWPGDANICGPLCTPSDILANKIALPQVMRGDLIAIDNAGAYGYSVSPLGFLSHPSPSEFLWSKGVFSLARASSGVTDLLASQQAKLPTHLMEEFRALGCVTPKVLPIRRLYLRMRRFFNTTKIKRDNHE
jgi:diaminopimelate decarboxylase